MKNLYTKYLFILFTALVLSSCCSTKRVIEQAPKEEKEVAEIVTEKPEPLPKIEETISDEITETESQKDTISKPKTGDLLIIDHDVEPIKGSIKKPIHSTFNRLLQKHVSNNGNVDYKGFKKDQTLLRNYIASLGKNMPIENWTKEDKLAYWMNAYNAMTIDLIIRNYPINSIKDINKPWDQRLWKLGSKWYNLNDIEHQILRKMNEPRIHFGIVCASFSCPKLINQAFTASNLESQLTSATKDFLADKNRNNISQNSMKLSKIFQWFAKDFKKDGSLIDFLNKYSEITISNKAKKSYLNYNWSLNE